MHIVLTGGPELEATFAKLGAAAPPAVEQGLYRWAEGVIAISKQRYVPVRDGHLRASGHVVSQSRQHGPVTQGSRARAFTSPYEISVVMGYGGAAAPYALAVHENPRAGKTRGFSPQGRRYRKWARVGEWKYLETPFKLQARHVRRYVAKALRDLTERSRTRTRGFRFR